MLRIILSLLVFQTGLAQTTKHVLFLGNSYTGVNNLPQLCADMAASTGNMLIHDNFTPGGYTFEDHWTATVTTTKIQQGNWDFVVLQEQSQRPALPDFSLSYMVYEYATLLNNKILQYNPCAETVFYMTWGRKNGDSEYCPYYTPMCTYEGMDDRIYNCYMTMTQDNTAVVSPVGAVWRYIRTHHPELELYADDGSHPSLLGSYAAACTFYTALFRNDPSLITYEAGLAPEQTSLVKNVVKMLVYEHLSDWKIGSHDAKADYTFASTDGITFEFANASINAQAYLWDFGDGQTSEAINPAHTFESPGNYTVILNATNCGQTDIRQQTITVMMQRDDWTNKATKMYPNPVSDALFFETQSNFLSVQLYDVTGKIIIEANNLKDKQSIDVSALAKGCYLIRIKTDTDQFTQKLIKQ
ncbi:T9SS type A sorting domain-containing protein [Flavobacterium sp.]|uniref:T9SS type A sorting domain-containing protein n=1 Tax=Flavobacterium sp. TaxID=239 RepID=UPI0039E24237